MRQLASSVLSFFLSPFNWIIILVIAGFLFRRASLKKICRIMALCIFLLFSNKWLLDWYAKQWQPLPASIDKNITYSCGIVPGGFGSPAPDGSGYFNATADRFIQAEKLYKLGVIKHILISGGNGKTDDKSFREGRWAKGELVIMGIPDSVIFVEDRSNDTFDNAVYAKQILDSLQINPPYLLITSASHMPRASLIFKNAGITTVAYPCNYVDGRSRFSLSSIIPQPSVLLGWDVYLKEAAAYVWYKLK
ncbi:YdcF family protein [Ginsengibacter hankyongi]|uniref:YdcF family protein n=2 Tax=Ginsengibacter hankyongi TaxID=2607284 RepID=A0A5J5IEU3_9BACT|nr:YdcF family protein [Ginsengibacter hankyongi]